MVAKRDPIVVKIEQHHEVMVVAPLSERMEISELPVVLEQVLKLCRDGRKLFVVDFSRVLWMTPSLPGILVDLTDKITELGGRVCLAGLSEQAKASLEIYKIRDRFEVFDTAEQAVTSLRGGKPARHVVYAEW